MRPFASRLAALAAVLPLVLAAMLGRTAAAQLFADDFADGEPGDYWELSEADPAVSMAETGNRLEFSAVSSPSLNTKKFAGYLGANWSLRTTSNFAMRLTMNSEPAGISATAGSAQSLVFGFAPLNTNANSEGFPLQAKLINFGARRIGPNTVVRYADYTRSDASGEVSLVTAVQAFLNDPFDFYAIDNNTYALTWRYSESMYLKYTTANDTLTLSRFGYNDPDAIVFAGLTGGQRYPVRLVLGGYALSPSTLPGSAAWYDSLRVDAGTLDAAPANVQASDGTFGTKVRVTWAAAPNATAYKVFRTPNGGATQELITLTAAALAYDDTLAATTTEYTYTVRTVTANGDGFEASDDGWRNIPTPTGVSASDSTFSDRIEVTWTAVPDATGYTVWRAVGSAAPALVSGPEAVTGTTFSDTTANIGTTYAYSVKAVSILGPTVLSASDNGTRAPYPPTGVAASDGDFANKIRVSWTPVPGAGGYKVYRTQEGADPTLLATVNGGTSAGYDDTQPAPLVVTGYKVASFVGTTVSAQSDEVTGWKNLSGPAVTCGKGTSTAFVAISWSAVTEATGYSLYRTAPGGAAELIESNIATTSYLDTTASPLVSYSYSAKCEHALGLSTMGAADTGWRNIAPPTSVAASDGDYTNRVVILWASVPNATGYTVWRKLATSSAAPTQIANINGIGNTTYGDAGASVGVNYSYSVKAKHALGSTDLSASDTGWRNLAAPGSVAATDGTYADKVRVTWGAVSGATGFKVYRAPSGGTSELIATLTGAASRTYDDSGADRATLYTYTVRTTTAAGDSGPSASNSGWRNLDAPVDVVASDQSFTDKVQITWTPVSGATGYRVFRKFGASQAQAIGDVDAATSSFDDTTATPAKFYSYTVAAKSALGLSKSSAANQGSRSLSAPTNIAATDGTSTANVRLTWTKSVGASGYKIYRRPSGGASTLIKAVGNVSSYDDKTAVAVTQYYYTIVATVGSSISPTSADEGGWRNIAAPTLNASDGTTAAGVALAWNAVNGATGYRILRTPPGGIESELTEVGAVTSYTDASADPLTLYTYRVQCLHGLGTSAASASKTGWRNIDGPAALAASDGTYADKITVTWDPTVGTAGYSLWRKVASSSAAAVQIATVSDGAPTTYDDTTAVVGTSYSYFVKAKHDLGSSMPSVSDTGWRNTTAPSAIAATDGGFADKVRVSWGASAGATSYRIYRQLGVDPPELAGTRAAGANVARTFDDTGALPATQYTYTVSAVLQAGEGPQGTGDSGWRNVAITGAISASDGSYEDRVEISWPIAAGASGYRIYCKIGNTPTVLIGTNDGEGSTQFEDYSVPVATLATYTVQPFCDLGDGTTSAGNTGWRNRPAPENVLASDGDFPNKVVVTWDAVPTATGYRIYRQLGLEDPIQIGSTGASVLTFNDTDIQQGDIGSYSVAAVIPLGLTARSLEDIGYLAQGFMGGDGGIASGGTDPNGSLAAMPGSGALLASALDFAAGEGSVGAIGILDSINADRADEDGISGGIELLPPPDCSTALARIDAQIAALESYSEAYASVEAIELADRLRGLAEESRACAILDGDLDGNGLVNDADLARFLEAWVMDDIVYGDIDRDGVVGPADYMIVRLRTSGAQDGRPAAPDS
jgi:fibronectin type 3 domain-containing protein